MSASLHLRTALLAAVGALLVVGCSSGSRYQDLDAYMAEVRARPKPPVAPLPEFKAYEPFAYGAAGQRSPFEPPAPPRPPRLPGEDSDIEPDPNRVKQYLETFAINDLRMVGTLEREGEFYALIRDSAGSVHRVTEGDYMGLDHGEILEITEASIEMDEIVSDGLGGWVKRSRTVQLASSEP
ncbi:MAG: pilus assembly protein PilP [Pseudomonadales bacterium]|jgi:type IV pilus assembly protein PilP|nr:pilus assembly protein PilP [Pseudomonadales bacterium]